ncbi:MAG: ATP-dependent Clp protease proteolytic subunit [Candidatus Heimdallarchaeota archaeon]|nr:MAG: ATP-dependent Clp protease proteolytic subunit [Candidatus Heimdallarchaeota archaeon]
MSNYSREDIDRWFDYSYLPSKRLIHLGSHDAEMDSGEGESGTDCQMSEFLIKAIVHANNISSKPIVIHMNNIGGDWYHGMSVFDAIRASPSHVYGICWGHAMSMGSIIIQACDTRIVAPHCTFMIHDGFDSLSGTCRSVQAWSKYSIKLRKKMYELYLSRMINAKPRMNLKKIEKLCSHDTLFAAEEAVKYGLADWILETLDDPYKYYATNTQNGKWLSGMKPGKNERYYDDE